MKTLFFIFIIAAANCAYCCGPSWPPAYLNNREWTYHPNVRAAYELDELSRKFCKPHLLPFKKEPHISTLKAALKDLKTACRENSIPEDKTEQIIARFKTARDLAGEAKIPEDFSSDQKLKEFCLYIKGIGQMHQDSSKLPAAWLELLKLPKEQRQYRTTWTLFMLGNMLLRDNPEKAHEYYEKLRNARQERFSDSLNLAYKSYRNEYIYASSNVNRFKYILACYAAASQAQDKILVDGIIQDLKYMKRKIYDRLNDYEKRNLLKDPVAREMILLAVSMTRADFPEKTLNLIGNVKIACAERLAWLAYYRGKFEECKKFLCLTDDNSMIKLWLLARFARREGNYEEAARLLKKWLILYRNREKNPVYLEYGGYSTQMTQNVEALYGTVLVNQQNIIEALYSFLKASSWIDAAFLAERMVSLNELIIFCKNHKKSFDERTRTNLEHLLARRLMRKNRFGEAEKWMPLNFKKYVKEYRELDFKGNDSKLSADERALAFYNLAKLIRRQGDILFATEYEPDFYYWDCSYTYPVLDPEWYDNNFGYSLRYLINKVPKNRFHYSYKAAQFMNRAAMLTQNINLKAAALYIGGTYIKYLSPEMADVYYKMLCDLRPFPFAVQCDKARWFPRKVSKTLLNETYSTKIRDLKFFDSIFKMPEPEKNLK